MFMTSIADDGLANSWFSWHSGDGDKSVGASSPAVMPAKWHTTAGTIRRNR
jgi:hypothetical protein